MMMFETSLVILLIFLTLTINNTQQNTFNPAEEVHDLIAEPDYRAVQLKWNYPTSHLPASFRIRYCEITSWNSKNRCKEQLIHSSSTSVNNLKDHLDSDDAIIELQESQPGNFHASLTNLRMLTNYSIAVWPTNDSNQQLNEVNGNFKPDSSIFVETKSFSARTSRCLANSSEIEVQTGPYFRGKISVEGANNPECAVYGNRTSEQNLYKFVINNEACGARLMNSSRIETMVIVHENKEILTHNSRRYLVICTFHPEIYSLTASVSVPSHLLRKVFERLRDRNYQLSAGKKQTRNKMKRFSQSTSTTLLKSSQAQQQQQQQIQPQQQQESQQQQQHQPQQQLQSTPFRDSRALSPNNEQNRWSGKLTSIVSPSSSSSSLHLSSRSHSSESELSPRSLAHSGSTFSSLSARDNSVPSVIDIVAEHKFLLSSVTVLLLCLAVSIYLLVSHYRCSRSHYSHGNVHHSRYCHHHHEALHHCHSLHSHQQAKHTQTQQSAKHQHQHRLSPHLPFDKRRHFDSLESARKDSILNV